MASIAESDKRSPSVPLRATKKGRGKGRLGKTIQNLGAIRPKTHRVRVSDKIITGHNGLGKSAMVSAFIGLSLTEKRSIGRILEEQVGQHFLRDHLLKKQSKSFSDMHIFALDLAKRLCIIQDSLAELEKSELASHNIDELEGNPSQVFKTLEEVDEAYSAMIFDGEWEEIWPNETLLSTKETASLLKLSVPAVVNAINSNKIIGLKRTHKRSFRVPEAQFGKKNSRIEYLDLIIKEIGSHNTAWEFLTKPFPFDKKKAAPLDLLKSDFDLLEILNAARSFSQDYL
ncbi:MAG: hypothetical protein COA43_00765 [Robiginitomaculum sp.]|nr:MAG: hypothetical protein COA43_00765 [Robiginitomaculum sp.]